MEPLLGVVLLLLAILTIGVTFGKKPEEPRFYIQDNQYPDMVNLMEIMREKDRFPFFAHSFLYRRSVEKPFRKYGFWREFSGGWIYLVYKDKVEELMWVLEQLCLSSPIQLNYSDCVANGLYVFSPGDAFDVLYWKEHDWVKSMDYQGKMDELRQELEDRFGAAEDKVQST